jgi:hypothetical protein
MEMKKTITALALATIIGTLGLQQAFARGNDASYHHRFHRLDAATQAKIDKFETENQALRKQIFMKQAEEMALIRSENPDLKAVGKTAGELYDLKATMREKVRAAHLFPVVENKGDRVKFANRLKKIDTFLAETKDIRKQVFVKHAQERALMHSKIPNAEEVAKISGELFDLRTSLHNKAKAAGIERPFIRFNEKRMEHERRPFRDRGFGLMGDNAGGPQGPDMGGGPLFAGK